MLGDRRLSPIAGFRLRSSLNRGLTYLATSAPKSQGRHEQKEVERKLGRFSWRKGRLRTDMRPDASTPSWWRVVTMGTTTQQAECPLVLISMDWVALSDVANSDEIKHVPLGAV